MTVLISLKNIVRQYLTADGVVEILKGISLEIDDGEMVAITGASGSGKSTLMSIIGCLDKSSSGEYKFASLDVPGLNREELAQLRREKIGFVFQGNNLLHHLDALHNVELPAIYKGTEKSLRREKAMILLSSLGLGDKIFNKPNQLSGGQQQRISIARALINGGHIILADEPTGALDSVSGSEVIEKLKKLNSEGYTVVIVTHDANVANKCQRIIRLQDGRVISDSGKVSHNNVQPSAPLNSQTRKASSGFGPVAEAFMMAIDAIYSHKLRSTLTMLGIIIGIASVSLILILGSAAEHEVLSDLKSISTNTINIYPGTDYGDDSPENRQVLTYEDINILQQQSYVEGVTSSITTNLRAQYQAIDVPVVAEGTSPSYFKVYGMSFLQGQSFSDSDVTAISPVAILDKNTAQKIFPFDNNVIGKQFMLGPIFVTVIGVVKEKVFSVGSQKNLKVWLPYTTMQTRITGQFWVDGITVRLKDRYPNTLSEKLITQLIEHRHNKKDFFVYNMDSFLQIVEKITGALQLFLAFVAIISLLVGGIGVMNIMLVSVSERTKEIGIRMSVGARNKDILSQFLIESVAICLAGGLIGILFSLLLGFIAQLLLPIDVITFPVGALCISVTCSIVVGVLFGWYPARKAAMMSPSAALSHP